MRRSRRSIDRARSAVRLRSTRECADARDERGSASLEFLTVGLILLVPLVYLVLAVAALQAGALGVEGAARQAARIAALGVDDADAAIERAVQVGLADYGVDASTVAVEVNCADGAGCTAPGSRIRVDVSARVALPLVPDVLDLPAWSSVLMQASATQTVSRFAAAVP